MVTAMTKQPFTDEQVDLAIAYVIAHCAEDRGKTVSYSLVFAEAGMGLPQDLYVDGNSGIVYAFMEAFHNRCHLIDGRPPLDALVVNVTGSLKDKPGGGYFTINGLVNPFSVKTSVRPEAMMKAVDFWEAQIKECYDWGVEHRRARLRNR